MSDSAGTSPGFGELLRRYRVAAGLTQEALADRAGLSARGLSDLERGVRAVPRKDTLRLLQEALALEPGDRAAMANAARVRPSPRTADRSAGKLVPSAGLPLPPDALIGREEELAAVVGLLRDPEVRLVTLTGPGGVGKTRLALQVAAELSADFPEGIAFVALAAIRDPELVLATIAQTLGVRESPERSLIDGLAVALRGRAALLVLDNLEQVLTAVADIAALIAACPDLRILVTSRMTLRLASEHRFPVAPLSLPDAANDTLADNSAVRLFVRRARQVRPDFTLTSANAVDVVDICRRLDGLPLAIELAASRLAVLPPAALLARLKPALSFLRGGATDQPQRLQTMRDAIAWSYDLLAEPERAVFRQLAVFEGGFTLEAAEAVCPTVDDDADAILDGVTALVEMSLLRTEEGPFGEPRFAMLETIREYGLEQLAMCGEEAQGRERHASWVLHFAEEAEPALLQSEQRSWWERLERDLPNVRAALAWFESATDAERAQRLAGALATFGFIRGHLREGQDWVIRALNVPGDVSTAAHAMALCGGSTLAWFRGDNDVAWTMAEAALVAARDGDFAAGVARAQHMLAMTAWTQGDLDLAMTLGEEAIARERESVHPTWLAILLIDMGIVAHIRGDRERADAWAAEGLTIDQEFGNWWHIANNLCDLGTFDQGQGDFIGAARRFAEAMRLFHREMRDTWYIAGPLSGLAAIGMVQGRPERAARLLGVAAALREASGSGVWPWEQERDELTIATVREALGEEAFQQATTLGRLLSIDQAVEEAMAIATSMVGAEITSPAQKFE